MSTDTVSPLPAHDRGHELAQAGCAPAEEPHLQVPQATGRTGSKIGLSLDTLPCAGLAKALCVLAESLPNRLSSMLSVSRGAGRSAGRIWARTTTEISYDRTRAPAKSLARGQTDA